jgi:exodeoxyribonuclease V beta subunit
MRLRSVPSGLAGMPGGTDVGTFVHSVLEHTDFAVADLDAELTARVAQEQLRRHVDIGDPVAVVAGLRAALETPLGPLVDDVRLCDVGRCDRLDEVAFELPLVGGDAPTAALGIRDVASLLGDHLPAGDMLAGYAERLADPALQPVLRGYLAGSVDLVLRTIGADGCQRYSVIDYKTNWLGAEGEDLSAWHYRPAALAHEMQRAHYPLQALLYTCALHRYLRWRLPGYDPRRNLAGVGYLFLRGMGGAVTPRVDGQPCGVFGWRPPASLVEALSDLLDQGAAVA